MVMTISVDDEAEFTLLIADFIETLAQTNKFELKLWINTSELPLEYTECDCFYFTQEGFRVDTGRMIDYIFYDNIVSVKIIYG
jgi:hypothetical protein